MSKGNIVITGASTGIGLFTAKKFVSEGYRVFGSVRKEGDAKRVQAELGSAFVPLIFDVTDHKSVLRGADQVSNSVGENGVALLVNNAGIAVTGPTTYLNLDDYRVQFEVNFFGLVATTKAFLPLLGASKDSPIPPGKIFNISSVSGQMAFPFMGPYSASKHAVEGFSKALRLEMLLYGIDVIIIGPGSTKTPIWEKAEAADSDMMHSDYREILSKFRRMILKNAEDAMEVEVLASSIFDIFIDQRPKTRYAILKRKFTKWTLPRYILPARLVDNYVKKMFGFDK